MNFQLAEPEEPQRFAFDLETLDTLPTGIVLSFGVTVFRITETNSFEELVDRGINLIFDVKSQRERGCTESEATREWWSQQSQEAQTSVLNGSVHPGDLGAILRNTYPDIRLGKALWYCRGPHFDGAMVDHMSARFEKPSPWKYNNLRDVRTWFDFHPKFEWGAEPDDFVQHNSLHDSAFEALNMQRCWREYYHE